MCFCVKSGGVGAGAGAGDSAAHARLPRAGEDVLLQIFTSVVLQREPGTEAPFLEFIQRVCAECSGAGGAPQPIRPGCGGFGIRNFLPLFLSIEVWRRPPLSLAPAPGAPTTDPPLRSFARR